MTAASDIPPSSERPKLVFEDVDELVARLRAEEGVRSAETFAEIKRIHAGLPPRNGSPHTRLDPAQLPPRPNVRRIYTRAIFSKAGQFLGWYRPDQKAGRPSKRSPIQEENDAALEAFFKALRSAIPAQLLAAARGRRSGAKRRSTGAAAQMQKLWNQLAEMRVPKHERADRIAKALGCTVAYVRKVLNAARKQKRALNGPKNSVPSSDA